MLPWPVAAQLFCGQDFLDLNQCQWASRDDDPQFRFILLLILVRGNARFIFALCSGSRASSKRASEQPPHLCRPGRRPPPNLWMGFLLPNRYLQLPASSTPPRQVRSRCSEAVFNSCCTLAFWMVFHGSCTLAWANNALVASTCFGNSSKSQFA